MLKHVWHGLGQAMAVCVTNRPDVLATACSCLRFKGTHPNRTGLRLDDVTFFSRLTAEYPQQLASALARVLRPFTTSHAGSASLSNWRRFLARDPVWQQPALRIEDGASQQHLFVGSGPRVRTFFAALAMCGHKDSLLSACAFLAEARRASPAEPPLSQEQLYPFLQMPVTASRFLRSSVIPFLRSVQGSRSALSCCVACFMP